ncbi:MAG: hypothetical protein KBT00_00150 [Bacteroidales bacterium]|nr:hypothetical protein [Candidatus Cacconaster merdequi]
MKGNIKGAIRNLIEKVILFLDGNIIEKRFGRHLGFFFYIFLLCSLFITWNLYVESRLVKVREQDKKISELTIECQQLELDLVGMDNLSRIDRMLSNWDSPVKTPETPPERIIVE